MSLGITCSEAAIVTAPRILCWGPPAGERRSSSGHCQHEQREERDTEPSTHGVLIQRLGSEQRRSKAQHDPATPTRVLENGFGKIQPAQSELLRVPKVSEIELGADVAAEQH